MVPNVRQVIISTSDDPAHWRMCEFFNEFVMCIVNVYDDDLGPLLLTWINFDLGMDKPLHPP